MRVAVLGALLVTCSAAGAVRVWDICASLKALDAEPRVLRVLAAMTPPPLRLEMRSGRPEPVLSCRFYSGRLVMWTSQALLLAPDLSEQRAAGGGPELTVVRFSDRQLTAASPVAHVLLLPVSRLIVTACDGVVRICL